jgi:uncharacterized LabA/DUF88 family protein
MTEQLPVYAFIDGQNLHKSIEEQGWKLDYRKFRRYLQDKLKVQKAFYFVGYMKENMPLYKNLERYGFTLIYKKVLRFSTGETKGNVDAELILNAMIQFHNFEQVVIVAGDGDYYCLLEYLKKTNKFKSIIIPNKQKYSQLLSEFGNDRLFISDERRKLEYFAHPKI